MKHARRIIGLDYTSLSFFPCIHVRTRLTQWESLMMCSWTFKSVASFEVAPLLITEFTIAQKYTCRFILRGDSCRCRKHAEWHGEEIPRGLWKNSAFKITHLRVLIIPTDVLCWNSEDLQLQTLAKWGFKLGRLVVSYNAILVNS